MGKVNKDDMLVRFYYLRHMRQQGNLQEAEEETPSIQDVFSFWDECYNLNSENGLGVALSFLEEMIELGVNLPTHTVAAKLCHSLFTKSLATENRERIFEILRQIHGNSPEIVTSFLDFLTKAQSSRPNSRLVAISSVHFMTFIINHSSKRVNLQEFFQFPNDMSIKEIMERILFLEYPSNYQLNPFEKAVKDSFRSRDSEVLLTVVELLAAWSFRVPEMAKFFLVFYSEMSSRLAVKLACLKVLMDICFISLTCFEDEEDVMRWQVCGKDLKEFIFQAMKSTDFDVSGIAIFGVGRMLQTDLFADDEVESVICQLVSAAVGQDQKKKQGKICFKMVESTLKKYGESHQLELNNCVVWLFLDALEDGTLEKASFEKKKIRQLKRDLRTSKYSNFLLQLQMLSTTLETKSLQVTVPVLCNSIVKNMSGPFLTAQGENVRLFFDFVISKIHEAEKKGRVSVQKKRKREEKEEEAEEFDEY